MIAEFAENIPMNVQRTPHVTRRRKFSNDTICTRGLLLFFLLLTVFSSLFYRTVDNSTQVQLIGFYNSPLALLSSPFSSIKKTEGDEILRQQLYSFRYGGTPVLQYLLHLNINLLNLFLSCNIFETPTLRVCPTIDHEINILFVTGSNNNKSSTLPLSYRYCNERPSNKDRDGYYSDRNEIIRETRERDAERERGYLSDYNSR